jgi:hypothetical protein
MIEIMSPLAFKWFLTLVTGIVAGVWFVWDGIKLMRLRDNDPVTGDKRFGYVIGMTIGAIGITGCLMFHGVL